MVFLDVILQGVLIGIVTDGFGEGALLNAERQSIMLRPPMISSGQLPLESSALGEQWGQTRIF
jgi:hypothetical protein